MRSREQLERSPAEYADYKRAERKGLLRELLRHLARVRAERPEWYVWVTEGQPILTPEQYAELGTHRRKRPASDRSGRRSGTT